MSDLVGDLCAWASRATCNAIGADLVPGTTGTERSSLAALGGLVRGVVGGIPSEWPEAVQQWAERGPEAPVELVAAVRERSLADEDLFALTYEGIVSGQNRRRLGTFFTPPSVVDLMLDRADGVLPTPAVVIDPGAGVGAFSIAACKRWSAPTVAAVDVNVVTLGLLAARSNLEGAANRIQLIHADFLSWLADGDHARHRGPTLLLGNPPYTRHQELDAKSKAAAMDAAGGLIDSGLAGLAAYFLAASLRSLRDQDALTFVLPGSWTESRYGRPLREWLWAQSRRAVDVLAFPSAVTVFPGTRVTALVLVVGPAGEQPTPISVEHMTVQRGHLEPSRTGDHARTDAPPASLGRLLWPRPSRHTGTIALSEIGHVRRGVATGANHFFFLRDDDLKALPPRVVVPGLRRLRHVVGDRLDEDEHNRIGVAGHPRWLLSLRGPQEIRSKAIQRRLADGVEAGYHDRYLTRDREHWYAVEHVDPPDIFVSVMAKDGFRSVVNAIKAVPSNSMYGIYLDDPTLAPALCTWLNGEAGQRALRAHGRHYSNGLLKLEPRDYLRVRVPSHLADHS